jgi:hypothetical protein
MKVRSVGDLAPAQVANALGARGDNVCFEAVLEDGRIRSSYRMRGLDV